MDDKDLTTTATATADTAKPKTKIGRPFINPEDRRTIIWNIRLTAAETELLDALGGRAWFREQLRNAEWPDAPPDSVGTDASRADQ